MKKIIAFAIVGALAACGGSKKGGTTPDNKGSAAGSAMGGQGYGGSAAPAPAPAPSSGGTGY